ncbi:MAG: hypothetical protein ACR2N2_08375 [Acidimicrobiia bacterium]
MAHKLATASKRALLSQSFDRDGVYSSQNQVIGFDDALEMAWDFHGGAHMEIVGKISVHHEYATFQWRFVDKATGATTTGTDFCVTGPNGLLAKVVVFFD